MAKKQQAMEDKLGSWTDQANLTRNQPIAPNAESTTATSSGRREAYPLARSLLERIADVATAHKMTQNELVGYLLTWSLDQVESGNHQITRE